MARDPYRYFRIEAHELQEQLGKGLLDLDKGAAAPQALASVLRVAHTLKGAARVVKQREIADQSHAIEEALTPFRDGATGVSHTAVEVALKALDEISSRITALDAPAPQPLAKAAGETPKPMEPAVRDMDEVDALLDGLTGAGAQLNSLRRGSATLRNGRRLAEQLRDRVQALRSPNSDSKGSMLSVIAELQADMADASREVSDGIEQLQRQISDVRESAERLRLIPSSRMFLVLERAARDAALHLGKPIEFTTRGGSIRLDATVFSAMQGALIQAVRNAVAHGIEASDARALTGKPQRGRINVEISRRGHQVAFLCKDDGRGVDLEAVRSAAERKGMPADDAARLDSKSLLKLLLDGGLSTSSAVTQLAGRGIGLDLVRDTATRLHGTVDIRTEAGVGAQIEVVVPMSLASVDALIVESGGRNLGIPLDAVRQTLRVAPTDVAQSAQGSSILYEGQVIPFAPLERTLQSGSRRRVAERTWSTLVVEGAATLAAVGVERLSGTQNLVVRPLPMFAQCDKLIAGASINAEGNPQLVLDPDALVEHISRAGTVPEQTAAERTPILVIDDSLTTRMLEQSILESAGYEVDLAVSGEDALQRAHARNYALFLVDVEMPGMDGFSFVERARQDPQLKDIPAVLVTSLASPEHRRRGREVGAKGHIAKGEFDQSELLSTIRSLVGS